MLDYKFVVAAMSHLGESFYKGIIGNKEVELIFDNSDEVISGSDMALVSSGTATLQTALAEVPQIVCYKSGWLNYELGKRLIKVPFISLVNLIFGKEIVRELIQDDLNTSNLTLEINKLIDPI
jgi:lipid-A-disaccharide synthase